MKNFHFPLISFTFFPLFLYKDNEVYIFNSLQGRLLWAIPSNIKGNCKTKTWTLESPENPAYFYAIKINSINENLVKRSSMNIQLKNRETEGRCCLSFCRQTAFIATLACACWMIPCAFKEALKKKSSLRDAYQLCCHGSWEHQLITENF